MHRLRYAYNTNGCAHHRLPDALRLIAGAGYDGVALTLDWQHLDPLAPGWERRTEAVGEQLAELNLASVIETGARYLLDPAVKHEPTLVSTTEAGRDRRVRFLHRAIDVGRMLGSETVSFWAGIPHPTLAPATAQNYLAEGLDRVIEYAGKQGQDISFEPEPGMLIETNADFLALSERLQEARKSETGAGSGPRLGDRGGRARRRDPSIRRSFRDG